MKRTILLNHNENTRQVEEEEKMRFARAILETVGLPVEGLWETDGTLTVQNKIKLRQVLSSYGVKIIDYPDGQLDIYVEEELAGRWKKGQYVLKRDYHEIDPRKKLYLEAHYEWFSVFDEENEEDKK